MSFSLDSFFRHSGTRFRVYAQSPVLADFSEPVTITVSSPVGTVGPGPSDLRMYALLPQAKSPYGDADLPPFRGKVKPPVQPGPDGHFDHIAVDDPAFPASHMFATVRRVLDVWEIYAGGPIQWHFCGTHKRLEMIPDVPWDNAHFGWGFMECGFGKDDQGVDRSFALNFDVLAHETGHGIAYSLLGVPTPQTLTTAYRGFHESMSDCVAMISALHFDVFVDHVLRVSRGQLYLANELNRIGELSKTRQIRSASNALKMSDVISLDTPPSEVSGKEAHKLAQPMTGAIFDMLIEFFVRRLVASGTITPAIARDMRRAVEGEDDSMMRTGPIVEAYQREPQRFRDALCDARDMAGLRLLETLRRLRADGLSYKGAARTLMAVDRQLTGSENSAAIAECFAWREII